MDMNKVTECISEARRFIRRAEAYRKRYFQDQSCGYIGVKESGALRRSSMDLTRALAELRKVGDK